MALRYKQALSFVFLIQNRGFYFSLLSLSIGACSLKSLDDLQADLGKSETTAGHSSTTQPVDNTETGGRGGASSSRSGSTQGGASNSSLGGSTTTSTPGGASNSSLGGSITTSTPGGASNSSLGGSTTTVGGSSGGAGQTNQGGSSNTGGTFLTSSGGSTNFGGATNSGGITGSGGQTASSTTLSIAGSSGSTLGGTSSTSIIGGASGTGGTTAMAYNIVGQSCSRGVTCPSNVSCCTQLEVPAGSFVMGTNTDASRNPDEQPPHSTTLDRFTMDKFEVTVGRFRSFVLAYDGTLPQIGMGAHPKQANSGWQVSYDASMPASKSALQTAINCNVGNYQTYTETAGVRETMPMNCVSWYVAFAFCIWDGGRLPTEAEWEMGATGGTNDYRFPWGNTDPDPAVHAVMNCLGDGVSGCASSDLVAVGSRPSGTNQWGHLDLAGSLWEWTLDYYDATFYQSVGTCTNCANLSALTPRVIRGGNFTSTINALRATGRASKNPVTVDPYAGFRCVRSL